MQWQLGTVTNMSLEVGGSILGELTALPPMVILMLNEHHGKAMQQRSKGGLGNGEINAEVSSPKLKRKLRVGTFSWHTKPKRIYHFTGFIVSSFEMQPVVILARALITSLGHDDNSLEVSI